MNEYQPKGIFITQNDKGQYIYSDFFIKGGYAINKSNYQKYRTYAMRYVIGIIVAILLSTIIPLFPSILVGILTAIIGEILFRVKFLRKSCVYLSDYKKDKKDAIRNYITDSSFGKTIIKAILFVAFGALLILNAYDQNYTGFYFYLSWTVGIIAIVIAIILLILTLINRRKK